MMLNATNRERDIRISPENYSVQRSHIIKDVFIHSVRRPEPASRRQNVKTIIIIIIPETPSPPLRSCGRSSRTLPDVKTHSVLPLNMLGPNGRIMGRKLQNHFDEMTNKKICFINAKRERGREREQSEKRLENTLRLRLRASSDL